MTSLPPGWATCRISDVAEINPKLNRTPNPQSAVHFVPMSAVEAETGKVDVSQLRAYDEVRKGYTAFVAGDVIFAKITPCMENGKMAIVPDLPNSFAFGSTEFHVLRVKTGLLASYLYYFVSAQQFRFDAEHQMTGAVGQKRVPTRFLEEYPFSLPPTNEQRRIIAKIEELFSELDASAESLTRARAQLKTYRQALLKAAFEGKLTADWRKANASRLICPEALIDRVKAARHAHHERQLIEWAKSIKSWQREGGSARKPSKPSLLRGFRDDFSDLEIDLPPVPEGWAWGRLGYATCGVEYGTSAKSSKSGDVPVIRMGNLQNGVIDWSDLAYTSDPEEISAYSLRPNDVLFNRTNSPELVGKTAIYRGERPALFAGYLIRVNQIADSVLPEYMTFYLNSDVARKHGDRVKTDGVNQSNINGNKLEEYPFPYCDLAEQKEVVRILDEKLSVVDASTSDIELNLKLIFALRQSILKRAFSGRLVSQDASDEPAAALLTRLREQAATPARKPRRKLSA